MKIVVGAATIGEIGPLLHHFQVGLGDEVTVSGHNINFLITGIGSAITATSWLTSPKALKADFWLMIGIAGTYQEDCALGKVVEVVREQWGDLGAEHADGTFEDVFSLGLTDREIPPYQNAYLHNPATYTNLPKVNGLTVQTTSGSQVTIEKRTALYQPDIESMEGAGFFFAALASGKKFCQIRSVSNLVEPRDKSRWDIRLALEKLTSATINIITSLKSK